MTTAAVRRRLAELEGALAQIARHASAAAEMGWLKWATNAELDEMEGLYRDRADFDDFDDLTKLRVIALAATAMHREMAAAAAKERGDKHSADLHIPRDS